MWIRENVNPREKIGRVDEIRDQKAGVGGVAVLRDGVRFIYNLVTKESMLDINTFFLKINIKSIFFFSPNYLPIYNLKLQD